jgi:hypothetical protein
MARELHSPRFLSPHPLEGGIPFAFETARRNARSSVVICQMGTVTHEPLELRPNVRSAILVSIQRNTAVSACIFASVSTGEAIRLASKTFSDLLNRHLLNRHLLTDTPVGNRGENCCMRDTWPDVKKHLVGVLVVVRNRVAQQHINLIHIECKRRSFALRHCHRDGVD